jgi:hypothetical protein
MTRCIGINKYGKKCRRKIKSDSPNEYFCCNNHKPLNIDILTDDCIMCSEKFNIVDLKILKCNHAFHTQCLQEWFSKSKENNEIYECPICLKEYCKKISKPINNKLNNFYESPILNFLNDLKIN